MKKPTKKTLKTRKRKYWVRYFGAPNEYTKKRLYSMTVKATSPEEALKKAHERLIKADKKGRLVDIGSEFITM